MRLTDKEHIQKILDEHHQRWLNGKETNYDLDMASVKSTQDWIKTLPKYGDFDRCAKCLSPRSEFVAVKYASGPSYMGFVTEWMEFHCKCGYVTNTKCADDKE